VTYERASDEHGRLAVAAATNRLELGDEIRLITAPPGVLSETSFARAVFRWVALRYRQPTPPLLRRKVAGGFVKAVKEGRIQPTSDI